MNQLDLLILAIAYALLGALLLGLCVRGRWPAWIKLGAIALVSLFYVGNYQSLQASLGWPTAQSPPAKFLLVAQQIHEPDAGGEDPGRIYLWAAAIEDGVVAEVPRAYLLPYSKSLHSELEIARGGQRKGIPQIGQLDPIDRRWFATRLTATQVDRIEIFDLPQPTLPDK